MNRDERYVNAWTMQLVTARLALAEEAHDAMRPHGRRTAPLRSAWQDVRRDVEEAGVADEVAPTCVISSLPSVAATLRRCAVVRFTSGRRSQRPMQRKTSDVRFARNDVRSPSARAHTWVSSTVDVPSRQRERRRARIIQSHGDLAHRVAWRGGGRLRPTMAPGAHLRLQYGCARRYTHRPFSWRSAVAHESSDRSSDGASASWEAFTSPPLVPHRGGATMGWLTFRSTYVGTVLEDSSREVRAGCRGVLRCLGRSCASRTAVDDASLHAARGAPLVLAHVHVHRVSAN